jgi:hypothetical protein
MTHRIRHVWLILIGRVPLAFSTEAMELKMTLDAFKNAAADLDAAADRLIAKASSDAASLAQAQSDLANVEAEATAAIQPTIDKLNSAAPATPAA